MRRKTDVRGRTDVPAPPSTPIPTRVVIIRFQLGETNTVVYTRDFEARGDAIRVARGLAGDLFGRPIASFEDRFLVYPAETLVPPEHGPN